MLYMYSAIDTWLANCIKHDAATVDGLAVNPKIVLSELKYANVSLGNKLAKKAKLHS